MIAATQARRTRTRLGAQRRHSRWARPIFRVKSGGATITAEATADQSSLIVKYPGAIDTAPTVVDNSTVLSSLWQNMATLILEAIDGEIGPIVTRTGTGRVAGHANLRDLLDGLSLQNASENAGKLVGAVRVHATKPTSYFASVQTERITVALPYAGYTEPVFLAMVNQNSPTGRHSNTDLTQGPAIVRGDCQWVNSTTIQLQFRACQLNTGNVNHPTPVAPGSNDSFVMDGLVLFMASGDPAHPPRLPPQVAAYLPLLDGWTPMVSRDLTEMQAHAEYIEWTLGYGDSTTYAPTMYGPKGLNDSVAQRLGRFLEDDGQLKDFAFVTGEASASAFYEFNGLGAFIPFGRAIAGDNVGSNGYCVAFTVSVEGETNPDILGRTPAWFWVSQKLPEGVYLKARDLGKSQLDPRSYDYGGRTFKYALLAFGATSTPNVVL